jgi:hypothetical protein
MIDRVWELLQRKGERSGLVLRRGSWSDLSEAGDRRVSGLPVDERAPQQRRRLQRLRESLLRRDWTGVAVEIAIVAIGVLLAFRVEQWGQRRDHAREEHLFLERLYTEYGRAEEELQSAVAVHERVLREFSTAFAARSDRARVGALSRRRDFGCDAGYFRTAAFNDTIFQELINSGQLRIVTDIELRNDIRDLATAQAQVRDRVERGNDAARDRQPYTLPYRRFELEPSGRSSCYVEWEQLFKDRQAINASVFTYRLHQLVLEGRRDLLRQTTQVRHSIACKLRKPQCRA